MDSILKTCLPAPQAAPENAKIADFRWHDFRHSAAPYLAMNGATLAEIAEGLGPERRERVNAVRASQPRAHRERGDSDE
jgi:hypothetical protein